MSAPSYRRPTSVDGAVDVLQGAPDSRVLAGGTDLMVQMRLGHRSPSVVVDSSGLDELRRLDVDGEAVIGAGVTMRSLLADPALVARHQALAQAARLLGGPQIQAMATIGGNLCNASPAAETAPPLLVHQAVVEVVGPSGGRTLALPDFLQGPGRTALAPGELMVAIRLPRSPTGSRSAYRRLELRRSVDIAIVNAAARLSIDQGHVTEASIAIGAVHTTPVLVPAAAGELIGAAVSELTAPEITNGALHAAANACRAAARPIDDARAGAGYRSAMVEVIVRRAVLACLEPEPP